MAKCELCGSTSSILYPIQLSMSTRVHLCKGCMREVAKAYFTYILKKDLEEAEK